MAWFECCGVNAAVIENKSILANAQAVLNATQDDGHDNTVTSADSHSITPSGVQKAQLHTADFHFV
jgi:hypothetical protein